MNRSATLPSPAPRAARSRRPLRVRLGQAASAVRAWPHWVRVPRALALLIGLGLLAFVGALYPVLVAVCSLLLLIAWLCPPLMAGTLSALLLGLFLAGVNSMKFATGDLVWYLEHYQMLATMPLDDYLGRQIGPMLIKAWEPVYYTFSFLLSRLTGGYEPALPFTFTLLLYLAMGHSLARLCAHQRLDTVQTMVAVLVGSLVIITFTLSVQLIRQSMATCFLFCAAVNWTLGQRRLAVLLALLGSFTHTSFIVPAMTVLLCTWSATRRPVLPRVGATLASMAMMGVVGLLFANYTGAAQSEFTAQKDDGSISTLTYALDGALWAAVMALVLLTRPAAPRPGRAPAPAAPPRPPGLVATSLAPLIYMPFIVNVLGQPLALLRMYFYMDLFRGMAVFCIVCLLLKRGWARPLWLLLVACAWAYADLRVMRSPLYGGGLMYHLLLPVLMF